MSAVVQVRRHAVFGSHIWMINLLPGSIACLRKATLRGLLQVDQNVVSSHIHGWICLERRVEDPDALLADIEVLRGSELRRKGNAGVIWSRFA